MPVATFGYGSTSETPAAFGYGASGGGGAVAIPTDLSGLVLWCKADAGTYQDAARSTAASANNDPVGGWADQSGVGNHLSQATAGARPLLKTGILASKPGLLFDGSNDRMVGAGSILGGSSAYTKFVIVAVTDTTKQNLMLGGDSQHNIWTNATLNPRVYQGGSVATSVKAIVQDTPVILEAFYNGAAGVLRAGILHNGQGGGSQDSASLTDGTVLFGSYDAAGTNPFAGYAFELVEYNRLLTAAERASITAYLNTRWGSIRGDSPTPVLMFEGDSLTYGFNASSGSGTTGGTTYPGRVMAALGGSYTSVNSGVAGQTINQMDTDAVNVDKFIDRLATGNVCCFWGGTNDLAAGTALATVESRYQTYCADRQAYGWTVVAFTMMDRIDFTSGQRTDHDTFNTWLRANYTTFADALVDVAAAAQLSPAGSGANPTYYSDGVHLTDAGYQVVADLAYAAVQPLIATAATAFTMPGPSSGALLAASTAFTLTPNGLYTGTITPSDGAGGGTFTPTSRTWAGTSNGQTFTYTPATSGAKTISATASPSLTAPSNITYTAAAPTAPTGVAATAGDASALVSFTVTQGNFFRVTASTGPTATGMSSPITVTGLTNGTSPTFTVAASDNGGSTYGSESSSSALKIGAGPGGGGSTRRGGRGRFGLL